MKLKELKSLYKFDSGKNEFVIDVQLEDYRDAYSEWDFSPFVNRDLDDDLTEYLLECSYEITLKHKIVFDFHILNSEQDSKRENRSIRGMYNFFDYEVRKLRNYRMRVLRDTITFFVVASVLLVFGALLDEIVDKTIVLKVISEGLFIGGWVMIWEMFSTWFFDIKKVTRKIKHFRKLRKSDIMYSYSGKK